MKSLSNPIECFLCTAAVQGKDEYKTHLEKGHNMSSAHNIFKFSNKHKIGRKARNAKLKRKQLNNKLTKTNFQCEMKPEENFKVKFKLKSVQVNLKNMHLPKEPNEDAYDDDLNIITWYNRVKYQCLACERFFCGSTNIFRHVRNIHKVTDSTTSFYRLVSEDDNYNCKICNAILESLNKKEVESQQIVFNPSMKANNTQEPKPNKAQNEPKTKGFCWFFENGFCRKGTKCDLNHPAKMCRSFWSNGKCPQGNSCPDRHPLQICSKYLENKCIAGSNCVSQHPERTASEVSTMPAVSIPPARSSSPDYQQQPINPIISQQSQHIQNKGNLYSHPSQRQGQGWQN